jgi:hypothetical protein
MFANVKVTDSMVGNLGLENQAADWLMELSPCT